MKLILILDLVPHYFTLGFLLFYPRCAKSNKNYRSTETKYELIIFKFTVFSFLPLCYVGKKMGDETKKSHNQKNSWNRWLCLLTYRPNLVFCSHHQSLFGTQVVFMWRMFLRLFCISLDERVWFEKNRLVLYYKIFRGLRSSAMEILRPLPPKL